MNSISETVDKKMKVLYPVIGQICLPNTHVFVSSFTTCIQLMISIVPGRSRSHCRLRPPKFNRVQKAPSWRYRGRYLKMNTHLSVFFEIYKFCSLLDRSDLGYEKSQRKVDTDREMFARKEYLFVFCKILRFSP